MDSKENSSSTALAKLYVQAARSLAELQTLNSGAKPYSVDFDDQSDSGKSLVDFWRILDRHKVAILIVSFVGLLLGVVITIPIKPVFRANTSLEILNINADFMNMRPTQPVIAGSDSDNISEEETQAALLTSAPLLRRVSIKLNPNPGSSAPVQTPDWLSWLPLHQGGISSPKEKLLSAAANSVKVTNPPRTRILGVSIDSTDPQLAKTFADTLVQEFIKRNMEDRWVSTRQTGDWLSREINEARSKLQRSEDALQAYARHSGLLFSDSQNQTNLATQRLQQVQQQLSAAMAERITKQSTFELAKNSSPETVTEILNNSGLQSLRARLDDATRQVASLSALYNPAYSKLKQAEAEMTVLREALARQQADLLGQIKSDYESAARREKLLAAAYDAQARTVAGQDESAVQYNILKREVDSNRQLYDTMLQQMKQASIATALHASNVRVISPAYLQDRPVFPSLKMNAVLGLFAGCISSIGFFLVRERNNNTFRQPGDVKRWAAMLELGAIPHVQRGTTGAWNGSSKSASPRRGLRTGSSELWEGAEGCLKNVSACERPGMLAEAFQSVLTSLLLFGDNSDKGRVLVITSAEPAEGKTSVTSNLAIAAAQIGKKVLLVDADLRRPRMHDIFGLPQGTGLAEALEGREALDGKLDHIDGLQFVQQTGIRDLQLLTAGKPRQATAFLFHSAGFSDFLAKARNEYDLILMDTPPAMHINDARIIGKLADGVVLVARAEQTSRDALIAVAGRLMEDRIHLLGCILNDWNPERSEYPYPYHYAPPERRQG